MNQRPTLPFRFVAIVLSSLVLAVIAGGVYVYLRHVRYERVAVRHVPTGATAAARVDVERILLFEPVRRRLLPLGNRVAERRDLPPRLTRIERETGLKLGIQLREVLLALGPAPADWVLVLGGLFPRSDVIAGIERVLEAEGQRLQPLAGADAFVATGGGWAMGHAVDGVLVVASSVERLRAALEPRDTYQRIGLEPTGAGAFVADVATLTALAAEGVERVSGTLTLGDKLGVDALGRTRPGLESQLAAGLAAIQFGAPRVRVVGPGRLELHMDLSGEELDRVASAVAERVLTKAR